MVCAVLCLAAARAQTPAPPQTPALPPQSVQQSVTVVADRGLLDETGTTTSATTLTLQQLEAAPGLALDDRLHQDAGFTLYRRTSSWTANPTTEGVSLRGLGSTAASRTLVVSDQVPQNDPFGGWIHWEEIPALAIDSVDLLRGGSSDLYGSAAIGGVIDIVPSTPRSLYLETAVAGATEDSLTTDTLLSGTTRYGSGLGALSTFSTGGYITTAPALRGPVDVPANVTGETARLELRSLPWHGTDTAFLRGNVLNESRGNGTPLQTNAARLWRYQGGTDLHASRTTGLLRLFGSREDYRQSFSSINATRSAETLTNLQRVPTDELGFALQAARSVNSSSPAASVTFAAGLDLRDVRATDNETKPSTSITTSISARQREIGGFLNGLWAPTHWLINGSIRVDSFRTFNARQVTSSSAAVTPLPEIAEFFPSPHLGIERTLPHSVTLTANAFRAFRGPTMNELYRTGQVGQQTTQANNKLLAERATGFELGAGVPLHNAARLRVSYFWTEVNRPVSAVLLSQTATTQLLQRQNLGQIRSRGADVHLQLARWRGLDAVLGYQLAFATVTAFNSSSPVQANLRGKWIPEVPREMATATVNYAQPRIANLHLIASYAGQAFDDSSNQFILHPYARFDLSADRALGHGFAVFAAAQNLLNRSIDAGRTPILTLAAPRLVQGGLRYTFSR
jgi:outer membrane receptor protein involved in Fe transport